MGKRSGVPSLPHLHAILGAEMRRLLDPKKYDPGLAFGPCRKMFSHLAIWGFGAHKLSLITRQKLSTPFYSTTRKVSGQQKHLANKGLKQRSKAKQETKQRKKVEGGNSTLLDSQTAVTFGAHMGPSQL